MERLHHIPGVSKIMALGESLITFQAFDRRGCGWLHEGREACVGLEVLFTFNEASMARWILLQSLDDGPPVRTLAWEPACRAWLTYIAWPAEWSGRQCSGALTQHAAWMAFMETQAMPQPHSAHHPLKTSPSQGGLAKKGAYLWRTKA